MGTKLRTETYLENDRLLPVKIHRPTGRGKWPKNGIYKEKNLVARIEGPEGALSIDRGPKATNSLVNESILLHLDIQPSNVDEKLWGTIPKELVGKIADAIENASNNLIENLDSVSNEETATGVLFGSIAKKQNHKDWSASFKFFEFSKQTKEPYVGADVAVIIDVLNRSGQRCFKSIWFQAKIANGVPDDWRSLPRLEEQMRTMRSHTSESFGLIYTPAGIRLVGDTRVENVTLKEAIDKALQCRIGDKTVATLAESMNKKDILRLFITQR